MKTTSKQTAVDFLKEKLTYVFVNDKSFNDLFEQAKAMEKEQIVDAYLKDRRGKFDKALRLIYDAQKYYTETYESKTNL